MHETFLHMHETDELRLELAKTQEQLDNLRRGFFGRYDILVNTLSTLQDDMSQIRDHLNMKDDVCEQLYFKFPAHAGG